MVRLDDEDGQLLIHQLRKQSVGGETYALDDDDTRKLTTHKVNRPDKIVTVSVPDDSNQLDTEGPEPGTTTVRESIQIQALIAGIGDRMGLSIWLPRADRGAVLAELKTNPNNLLDRLPLNYDDTTLRTIEQIDVLWLRGRSIVRAFEVEHTTSVYSGILEWRIVSLTTEHGHQTAHRGPGHQTRQSFSEIRRPVFSLLEKGPLADSCTYLSYDSLRELASDKHLAHLSDSVLDEYAEEVE